MHEPGFKSFLFKKKKAKSTKTNSYLTVIPFYLFFKSIFDLIRNKLWKGKINNALTQIVLRKTTP